MIGTVPGTKADYVLRHPDRHMARVMIATAIRKGELVRPANCSNCGIECTAEAHHDDYSKPMDVVWLCRLCHRKADKESQIRHGRKRAKPNRSIKQPNVISIAPYFLRPNEVALRLDVDVRSLAYQRRSGKGPPWVKIEGSVRYPKIEFEKWLESKSGAPVE